MSRSGYSAVHTLILATIGGFVLEMAGSEALMERLALWPLQQGFMPWQLLSYALLHANISHLVFNMFGLWMFGRDLELVLGRRRFMGLYLASVASAAVAQLLAAALTGTVYPTVGASGGVFGVLLAYGMFFPRRMIMLLIPPIPMPAWLFVTVYAGIELVLGVTGTQAGVAHFAHLGGMVGAYLVLRGGRRGGR